MFGIRALKVLVGKSEGNISLRTHKHSWDDDIKIDIKWEWMA